MLTYAKPIKKSKQTLKAFPLTFFKPKFSVSPISFFQQTVGNQAVIRMMKSVHSPLSMIGQIQTKLKIGQPNDKYEKEADRIAEKIMTMPSSTCVSYEEERLQPKLIDEISPIIQRQETEEEEEEKEIIQPKRVTDEEAKEIPEIETYISRTRGSGNPLPPAHRAFMEKRFGVDFSNVRIHADSEAARMARALNAEAFTYGRDVYFGEGRYKPETTEGKKLLAHELTHVVQQGLIKKKIRPKIFKKSNFVFNSQKIQCRIMIAGPCDLFGEHLPHQWNELTRNLRREFLKKNKSNFIVYNILRYPLAVRIIEDMADTSTELKFDDENELLREVRKRLIVAYMMRISQGVRKGRWIYAFSYPNRKSDGTENCGPRVNEAAKSYWGPVKYDSNGAYYFELSPQGRKNPYEALQKLFVFQKDPCKRTLIHCDYLVSVLHFKAFAETLGKNEFNKRVKKGVIKMTLKWNGFSDITGKHPSASVSLQTIRVARKEDLIIGDHVIFHNHPMYDVLVQNGGGVWRLENAILVDRRNSHDLFQGHGYRRPVTEQHMKKSMLRHIRRHINRIRNLIKTNKQNDLEELYPNVRRINGVYRVIGTAFYGIKVDEPLRIPSMDELPGLYDPRDPTKLFPVRRPIESI